MKLVILILLFISSLCLSKENVDYNKVLDRFSTSTDTLIFSSPGSVYINIKNSSNAKSVVGIGIDKYYNSKWINYSKQINRDGGYFTKVKKYKQYFFKPNEVKKLKWDYLKRNRGLSSNIKNNTKGLYRVILWLNIKGKIVQYYYKPIQYYYIESKTRIISDK